MVSGFDIPNSHRRETNEKTTSHPNLTSNKPKLPIISRFVDDKSSVWSETSDTTFKSSNPFLSPKPSSSSVTDDESGSSSGQDEFRLERYSQDTQSRYQKSRTGDKLAVKRQKSERRRDLQNNRSRPGLNLVTDFSRSAKDSHVTNVVIDEVAAKRPDIARRTGISIISAKAEHVQQSPPLASSIPTRLKNTSDATWTRKEELEKGNSKIPVEHGQTRKNRSVIGQDGEMSAQKNNQNHQDAQSGYRWPLLKKSIVSSENFKKKKPSTSDRSIVIGISVPEHEAEAHRIATEGDSALTLRTPATPAIVVTPADEEPPWKTEAIREKRRPASSVYSMQVKSIGRDENQSNAPPLPQMPSQHIRTNQDIPKAQQDSNNIKSSDAHQRAVNNPFAYEDFEIGEDMNGHEEGRRFSSESTEHILDSTSGIGRAKSQGWWNLMLSPMLSRAGTLKKNDQSQRELPPVPTLDQQKWQNLSPELEISPETPKRNGLADTQSTTWSEWEAWEKSHEKANQSVPTTVMSHPVVGTTSPGHGLAAEYFHACAIEQLMGGTYFECQNHSCADKLPGLKSIFDKKPISYPSEQNRAVDGIMEMPSKTSSDSNPNHSHTLSNPTVIGSEPEELSPVVREADTAAVVRAKPLDTSKTSETVTDSVSRSEFETPSQPITSTSRNVPINQDSSLPRTERQLPNVATVLPATRVQPSIVSPGPVSPEMQRTMTSEGAVQMSEVTRVPQNQDFTPRNYHNYVNHYYASPRTDTSTSNHPVESQTSEAKPYPVHQVDEMREESHTKKETETSKVKSFLQRLKCTRRKAMNSSSSDKNPKKNRLAIMIGTILLLIIIACVVLATQLTRSGDQTPTQNAFLNLTGYPPMPTGISTIIRPDPVRQQAQCVQPSTLWSCAVPKESQSEISPNNPDQPNFRFEIKFRNGTVPANMTIPITSSSPSTSIRKRGKVLGKRANDPFTNDLFDPSPAPPSRADQLFIGNTTDNITEPFDGEETPFFMTFIPAFPIIPSSSNSTSSFLTTRQLLERQNTNLSDAIPKPDILSDGSAAPANILPTSPYPTSQPVRLYNRGLADEHYGFYMYYDKAIFLRSTEVLNSSLSTGNGDNDPADGNGGALRNQARARCTFSQTRFLVRIWTSPQFNGQLLGSSSPQNGSKHTNSATNFTPPGSFPYPTSISLDRHGGNVNNKAVYCYGVDDLQVIQQDVKSLVAENRGVGGALINPAPSLVNVPGDDDGFDQDAGGIDGGTGGCECLWQNWA